ncbi:cytochrome c [Cyanobium sp. Copco_Reservoir_LC18]|uniref:c-type cytochrome n=1 Tax=Cyanobium sp. Copco_Reservoir_LC18 TaxID=1328305 RepID=UPI00169BB6C4|nr:cytochrome c [Cyanobium sp. Copco_Reservoir_LC18]KAF0653722.1 cytochrome c [Cyanobium sp. Copco_Reservoir_LC18]
MISPSSTTPAAATPSAPIGAEQAPAQRRSLVAALATLAAVACILLLAVVVLPAARSDPYTRQTLELTGSATDGGRLFRLNCAGCHGLAAQGLVGPDLHGVDRRKNDRQLIQQVVSGRTPPMPSFQPEPQAMADLLAFLHSLP